MCYIDHITRYSKYPQTHTCLVINFLRALLTEVDFATTTQESSLSTTWKWTCCCAKAVSKASTLPTVVPPKPDDSYAGSNPPHSIKTQQKRITQEKIHEEIPILASSNASLLRPCPHNQTSKIQYQGNHPNLARPTTAAWITDRLTANSAADLASQLFINLDSTSIDDWWLLSQNYMRFVAAIENIVLIHVNSWVGTIWRNLERTQAWKFLLGGVLLFRGRMYFKIRIRWGIAI